jgi:hypothetical protein
MDSGYMKVIGLPLIEIHGPFPLLILAIKD